MTPDREIAIVSPPLTTGTIVIGVALLIAACSGSGGAADAAGTAGASGSGGSTATGGTGGAAAESGGGSSGPGGAAGSLGGASGSGGAGAAACLGTGGSDAGSGGAGTGGSAGGTGGTGATGAGGTGGLQFSLVGPQTFYFTAACGAAACYGLRMGNTAAYIYVDRLANTAMAVEDFSSGLGGNGISGLFTDGAGGVYATLPNVGVFFRAATDSSFAMVGNPLTTAPTARHALARDGNGTLFVATPTGVVALPQSCGSTFAAVGSGLTFAYAVVTDGTNLYTASRTVKVLPGAMGTWMDAGSNSPTSVGDVVRDREGRLYATSTATSLQGVYRLAADGSSWQNVTAPLNTAAFANGVTTNIVFDSQNYGYLLSESTGEVYGATFLARLDPGATSWSTMDAPGFPSGAFSCEWLAIDSLDRLVAACSDGLFRSTPLH